MFSKLATFAATHRRTTIGLYVLLAFCGLVLAAAKLEIDTNPGRMIAEDLPFRAHFAELNKTFPQFDNIFVVVVDAEDSETGRKTAKAIAEAFGNHEALFEHVSAPGTEYFFQTSGILYLNTEQIEKIVRQIRETRPLFLTLSRNPSMIGMEKLYDLIWIGAQSDALPDDAIGFLHQSTRTVTAATEGKVHNFDWQGLQSKTDGDDLSGPTRWYVLAKPILDFSAIEPAEKPLATARQIITDRKITGLGADSVRLTGEAAVNAEELTSVTEGATIAFIVSFLLVTIVVFFGMPFRKLIVPVLALLVAGIMIDIGFATLTIGHLNMISVAFAVLFIGLGIDYAVHYVLRFAEAIRAGQAPLAAIGEAADGIGPALFLCTLTTSLAFLVFSLTDFAGMAQLGVIAAGGIVIAFVASLTLIPAILMLMKWPQPAGAPVAPPQTPAFLNVLNKARPALTVLALILAASALFIVTQVRFDGDPINLKDPDAPTVQVFNDLIKSNPELIYAAQIIAPDAADKLSADLEKLDSVEKVNRAESFLPKDQDAKLASLKKLEGRIPDTPDITGDVGDAARAEALDKTITHLQKLAAYDETSDEIRNAAQELVDAFQKFKETSANKPEQVKTLEMAFMANVPDMFNQLHEIASIKAVTLDELPTGLRDRYIASDGRRRLEVVPTGDMRDETQMRAFVADVSKLAPNVTGAPVEITGAATTVSSAMKTAGFAALGLVAVLLLILFRSVRDAALVLMPIAVAACLLLAYTVAFNAPFNFANIIVFPLLLGLGVDSSIHYVMRMREAGYKEQIDSTSTPKAVLLSALTTIGSFGTLWLSAHMGLSSMGELLTISIICTLLCTLIVLPQVVEWVFKAKAS
ncbi:MAG: MMPL family transporter [Hyphomicrobiales bacterium]